MPDVNKDRKALDWMAENPEAPQTAELLKLMKLPSNTPKGWKFAKENPENPKALEIKNNIFENLYQSDPTSLAETKPPLRDFPRKEGLPFDIRFQIKNLISTKPELQKSFLERSGLDTKMEGNEVLWKRKNEGQFKVVDPESLDLWDVTDLTWDVAEGLLSMAGGPILGTALATGAETARQFVGKGLGLREEIDVGDIGLATAFGAAPAVVGKGIRAVGSRIRQPVVEGVEALEEAAKELGTKLLPSQIFSSPKIAKRVKALAESGQLFGKKVRTTVKDVKESTEEAADFILREAKGLMEFDIGDKASRLIREGVKTKLEKPTKIYKELDEKFQNIIPDVTNLEKTLDTLKDQSFRGTRSLLNELEEDILSINSLDRLKSFRTDLGERLGKLEAGNKDRIVKQLYAAATEDRNKTLEKGVRELGDEASENLLPLIKEADSLYKKTAQEVKEALLSRKTKTKGGPAKVADKFLKETSNEEMAKKVLLTNDLNRIKKVKEAFPEAFEELRRGKILQIAKVSKEDPTRLVKAIDEMDPRSALLIFGEEAILKKQALSKMLKSMEQIDFKRLGKDRSKEISLSDLITPKVLKITLSQFSSLTRAGLLELSTSDKAVRSMLNKIADIAEKKTVRGASVFGAQQEQ